MTMNKWDVVALGDSVTEGVGDPGRHGLRGWVHYLTSEADELRLSANLARSGATVAQVRRRQLDRAVALSPAVALCAIGVNDVLSGGFDAARFEEEYGALVAALAGAATVGVVTMTLHDFTAGIPLRRATRAELRRRIDAANAVVERVSVHHGAWVIDARKAEALDRSGMLSIDRLHPNRRGHRYIAEFARDVLRTHGVLAPSGAAATLPEADAMRERVVAEARHAVWIGGHVGRALVGNLYRGRRRPHAPRVRTEQGQGAGDVR
ncbi:GDSL-type esterase/lipase family protein [Streptomyces atratus]|uniref:GDSL-type esterase/lipase family protein n=1 Tax=Streptomyces atratus TaxID=1893 RepID=UPI00340757C4